MLDLIFNLVLRLELNVICPEIRVMKRRYKKTAVFLKLKKNCCSHDIGMVNGQF